MEDISALLGADALEDELQSRYPEAFSLLLKDHTMSEVNGRWSNIFWATKDYEELGEGYEYKSPILPELITGKHRHVIMPRVYKDRATQRERSKKKAEIFTPAWICNAQANLFDEVWFDKKDTFNHENDNKTWTTKKRKIPFPPSIGMTWRDYVNKNVLEMTCGEAPYLVSRYDAVTGTPIPLKERIGLLDRKLRVVNENVSYREHDKWRKWALTAFKKTYGYEWQGDSLLIARENLFLTFIEYYYAKFRKMPLAKSLKYVAYIISWNLWQMDGLKSVVPESCGKMKTLFGEQENPCPGCKAKGLTGMHKHNGIYCLIRNWDVRRELQKHRFVDILQDLK